MMEKNLYRIRERHFPLMVPQRPVKRFITLNACTKITLNILALLITKKLLLAWDDFKTGLVPDLSLGLNWVPKSPWNYNPSKFPIGLLKWVANQSASDPSKKNSERF